jgi:hypothetical protein
MRSPWQFISDLANRRRQRLAEQSSDPTADGGPDRLLLPAPSERTEDVATNGDAESQPGQPAHPLSEALHEEPPLTTEAPPADPVGDRTEDNRAHSEARETSSVTQTSIVAKAKVRAARAAKPVSRRKPDVTPASVSMPDQSPAERTFHYDVRSIDDDIKRLRGELADKLRLQNEHLKKMLERFDRQ